MDYATSGHVGLLRESFSVRIEQGRILFRDDLTLLGTLRVGVMALVLGPHQRTTIPSFHEIPMKETASITSLAEAI